MAPLSLHATNKTTSSEPNKHYLNHATESYYQGNYHQTLELCNLSIDSNAANSEAYRIRGLAWYKLGDIEKASQDMQKAVALINSMSQEPKKASRSILHLLW